MKNTLFYKSTFFLAILFVCLSMDSSKRVDTKEILNESVMSKKEDLFFKLSLAQWSLHRYVEDEKKSPFHFVSQAKKMGFEAVEYVSQLYKLEIEKLGFDSVIDSLNRISKNEEIKNVLIMVDDEGDLADPNLEKRNQAVENHKRWVDAAQKLGCHSIRVNTFGTNDPEVWKITVVDGLKKLSEYAATKNINVLCENHGWLSSDPDKLMAAIYEVNMDNCGTLPDFGNWCIERKDKDERWGDCKKEYLDKYKGMQLLMPAAKAVSAKSYDFDETGNETTIDYVKMLRIVKESGYSGYIGIEYEGDRLSEIDGIMATRDLLLNSIKKLH